MKLRFKLLILFMPILLSLSGCGKDSNYIGRYKEYDTGWLDRYLEINEDSTVSLYDSNDTLTGEWKVKDDKKSIEMKLTEIGTDIFNAEFAEEDNVDLLKVSGGYYGNKTAYYIREDSDTHNMLANYDVQQVLNALSEGVKINEINTYISNTTIAESEQNINQTVIDQDVTNNVNVENNKTTNVNTTIENTENTTVNTILNINNYKDPEIKINGENFDGLLKKAQKQSEDVMTSHAAKNFTSNEEFKKMDYLGYYALSAKSESTSTPFIIYLVYKVYVNNDKDGDISYYWYCKFDNIISLGQNEYSIDLSDYSSPDNRYNAPSGWYYYWGYESLDSVFHNVVAENVADYDYDSDIHDIEDESHVDDTTSEN